MNHFLQKGIGFISTIVLFIISGYAFSLNQITAFEKRASNRIQLTGTQPFRYHAFTLNTPPRLVLDIEQGRWLHEIEQQDLAHTPIKDIRVGHYPDHLRIVFDLAKAMPVNVYQSRSGQINQLNIIFPKKSSSTTRPVFYSAFNGKNAQKKKAVINKSVTPEVVNVPLPGRSSNVIVVIDPGHGGKDPGAMGVRGTHEKNVVLKIAKDLYRDINNQPGFVAKLTRTGDYYLTLRQRLAIARRYKADMFIAIHADAYRDHGAHGASVYALSKRGASSEAARWLAQRENESELMGGVELNDKNNILKSVLINLSQTATIRSSLQVGQRIMNSLGNLTSLHHQQVEQAAFVVLKSPDIPSLLVETGFISNPYEERRLNSPWYQQKIASALMQGIRSYFVHSPPPGTWLARQKFKDRFHTAHYIVQRGDTLLSIAERFNVTVSELMRQNNLHSSQIQAGKSINIPAAI